MNILVDEKGRKRFHDVTQIKEETLSQVDASTTQGHSASTGMPAHEVLQGQTPAEGSSGANTVPKSGDAVNSLAKMSYAQPSLFDQIYQQTFDFNRQAEQPKQQELDLSAENTKRTPENTKRTPENTKLTIENEKREIRNRKPTGAPDKIEDVLS